MASEIRVDNITSLSGVGTITPSATGVEIAGITTVSTLKATTGIVTALTATESAKVGSGVTLSPDGDVFTTGVTTSSTIKVGGGVTISESGIEASGIGITCANINGGQIGGRRNLVINGAMQVAQRGTSFTLATGYAADRFPVQSGGLDEVATASQISLSTSTSPDGDLFRNAARITNGNQTSGAQAGSYVQMAYQVEAQDMANSGWQYASSSSFITLSFYVRSSVAQTFYGWVNTVDGTAQRWTFDIPVTQADTWTKIVKTIPGNSNLTFDNNTGAGLQLVLVPYYGTNYTNDKALNSWAATDGANYCPDMTTTWFTTNDSTFDITGVQIEVGPEATPFEHRNFGEELALCQRYFQNLKVGTAVGSGSNISIIVPLFCPMRATPSLGKTSGDFNFGDMVSQGFQSSSSPTIDGGYLNQDLEVTGYIGGFSGPTNYRPYRHEPTASDGALITANAEL